jgi:hypothetical protein
MKNAIKPKIAKTGKTVVEINNNKVPTEKRIRK